MPVPERSFRMKVSTEAVHNSVDAILVNLPELAMTRPAPSCSIHGRPIDDANVNLITASVA
jgi:hypothetical protein